MSNDIKNIIMLGISLILLIVYILFPVRSNNFRRTLTGDQTLQKGTENFGEIEDMKASVTTTGGIETETFSEVTGSLSMKKSPVDQILQKIADNFGKIEDMRASVTTTGSIGAETFSGVTGNFLMKKPDKVKVTTSVKDEAIIFKGDKMKLIEKGEVEELGFDEISDMPLSLLDFYYHLKEFKEGHNIAIIDRRGDTYTLEATPKTTFISKYDRMKIVIDYSKGLDIKKEVFFDQSSVPQLVTEIKDYQLIGDVYIPSQIVERIVFKDATVTSITTYSNIQINRGIPDSEF